MPLDYSFDEPALKYMSGMLLAGTPLDFLTQSDDLCPFSAMIATVVVTKPLQLSLATETRLHQVGLLQEQVVGRPCRRRAANIHVWALLVATCSHLMVKLNVLTEHSRKCYVTLSTQFMMIGMSTCSWLSLLVMMHGRNLHMRLLSC